MEGAALCFTLSPFLCSRVVVVLLLVAVQVHHRFYAQETYSSFPKVIPRRLQFFEGESLSIHCEKLSGLSGWKVMQKTQGETKTCGSDPPMSFCTIQYAFLSDSGEYWCKADGGERSSNVTIAVTGGSVILESPSHPVMEGDTVTLRCVSRTHSDVTADFYQDGGNIGIGYKGKMTISSVSKSNEGLYKCSISGAGESAQSWLDVRALSEEPPHPPHSSSDHHPLLYIVVFVLLLVVVVGIYLYWKNKGTFTSFHAHSPLQTDPGLSSCSATRVPSTDKSLETEENPIYHTIE